MAGDLIGFGHDPAPMDRVQARPRPLRPNSSPTQMVRAGVGSYRVQIQRDRGSDMPDPRLWRENAVRGWGLSHPRHCSRSLGKGKDQDFHDVSLVDGYNLPIYAAPRGYQKTCNATGCAGCPRELQVEDSSGVVACKSACEAFRLDQYCCSGEFANPTSCKPSFYSTIFKTACPRAYSSAFDDRTSTFTCKASEYSIIFCPAFNGMKRSKGYSNKQPTGQPSIGYSSDQPTSYSSNGQPSYWHDDEDGYQEMTSPRSPTFHLPSLILVLLFFSMVFMKLL